MSSNYTPSNQDGSFSLNALFATLVTLALFGIMPLMQFIEARVNHGPNLAIDDSAVQPPPPPPEDQPPPPDEQEDIDEPEMEEPPVPMTLAQLEMALNPGSGDAVGDFGFGDFNNGIDALDGLKIFNLSDVDKKPNYLIFSEPQYPYSLKQSKTKGSVTVFFILTADGKVHRARAVKSTHREFEQPAIDAVKRSTWQPAYRDGKAVACKVHMPVEFSP